MGIRSRLRDVVRKVAGDSTPDRGPSFPRSPSPDGLAPLLWDHEVGYERVTAATLPDGQPGVLVCCRRGTYALRGVDPAARLDTHGFRLVSGEKSWDLFTGAGQGAPDAVTYAARSQGAVTWVGGPCSKPEIIAQIVVSQDPLGLTIPAGLYPPARLAWRDVTPGSGPAAGPQEAFDVDYLGILWSSGAVYDSTWRRRRRYHVDMQSPTLLEGWRQGLAGMRAGGLRLLIVPPYLGYGEEEIEETVPSGETLLFLVQRS